MKTLLTTDTARSPPTFSPSTSRAAEAPREPSRCTATQVRLGLELQGSWERVAEESWAVREQTWVTERRVQDEFIQWPNGTHTPAHQAHACIHTCRQSCAASLLSIRPFHTAHV